MLFHNPAVSFDCVQQMVEWSKWQNFFLPGSQSLMLKGMATVMEHPGALKMGHPGVSVECAALDRILALSSINGDIVYS